MKASLAVLSLSLLLPIPLLAQTLTMDKLEQKAIASMTKKEVGFSALLEGTVSDPLLEVIVFVYQPRLKGWRVFPASTEYNPEATGLFRWRAICQFGELSGKGVGDTYQLRTMAFDTRVSSRGLPEQARALEIAAAKTDVIVLKRVK